MKKRPMIQVHTSSLVQTKNSTFYSNLCLILFFSLSLERSERRSIFKFFLGPQIQTYSISLYTKSLMLRLLLAKLVKSICICRRHSFNGKKKKKILKKTEEEKR